MMKTTNLLKWVLALIMGLCLIPASAFASNSPNWTIDTHEFEYDMSMYVSIQRNGVLMGNPSDLTLAAFVGEECRGLANLLYVSGTPYFYLRVRSHVLNGETVSFRCYDASRGSVDSVMAAVQFENLKQFGFPSVPYVMALFIPVTHIALDEDVQTLLVNQLDTLAATVLPADATDQRMEWLTSDASVAVVKEGVVTALKAGSATISVKTMDGGLVAQCFYTVLQPVLGILLDKDQQTLLVNRMDTLLATVLPLDASNKDLVWSSSDETLATVDAGVVTALKPGLVAISVKTLDGGFSAQCMYTVLQPVTGIQLNKANMTLLIDQSETLTATVSPLDASDMAVTWSSSDASVAQVTDGVVTALGSGSATITAQTNDGGWTASCQVYVKSYYQVTVHYSTHGYVSSGSMYFADGENVRVLEDSVMVFKLTSDKSSEVGSVLYNGVDVTSQIQVVDGNSYFTTPPITQNTSLSVQFQLLKFELTIKDAESGSIGILVEPYQKQVISIHTSVDWELYSVLMNDVEVLGEVIMNTYTTPVLTAPSTLQIIMKKIVPIHLVRAESPVQLKGSDGMITVKGVVLGERIRVYDLKGRLVKSTRVTGVETTLKLNPGAVHILKIGSDTFKVAI